MSNNKISWFLRNEVHIAGDTEECVDEELVYAAQLDRLAEAARAVVCDADGEDPDYRTVQPKLIDELAAALAAIELSGGDGLTPLPKGMSDGFYNFMRPGCPVNDSGEALMNIKSGDV